MEEYLQYMKTLRSQMNDVEDQAAKISVEEQMQITTIQTMEKDLESAKSETKQLREDGDRMIKVKGQVCSQILDKQRKMACLEFDSSTLSQTLELMQQERVGLSVNLTQKSTYYARVAEDINTRLQQQQEWFTSNMIGRATGEHGTVRSDKQTAKVEGKSGTGNSLVMDENGNDARKNLTAQFDSAQAKLDEIVQMKSKLVMENIKLKQSIDKARRRMKDLKPELLAMDIKTIEDEHKALLSDKSGETEYLQSLQDQIEKLKGIDHIIKCACGQEYKVGANFAA
ncbi:uncharacterized protein LOC120011022 isoform X3 [Tripterygium wilfordii]|uniref:uncharacterized protein LOC120011022 isoform X3 n=1 Tax=Tripterygium wilfordii TaxID=458696 RepID=UPI0018F83928|nr:uncharacterized protein LOC120011022 isoform X3 [Tripterygium wilfordii]